MIKLIKKLVLYGILIFTVLEILVRVFHLYNDVPNSYIDSDGTVKWSPGQNGYAVYGNRAQNLAEYQINERGYNSYREFKPTKTDVEVAIVGDSFIEGFHQDYYRSIGKKVEEKLPNIQVYEYGHQGTDLAEQLHLIQENKETFDLVDYIIIGFKYENDLDRSEHRIKNDPPSRIAFLRNSKLVVYMIDIGLLDPVKTFAKKVVSLKGDKSNLKKKKPTVNKDSLYLQNFKSLISKYGFNKDKMAFLLDSRATNNVFLEYLNNENINYIDYADVLENATDRPTTLIYDFHWNNYGRTLVSEEIVNFLVARELN